MKIIALDSSSLTASVAIAEDDRILAEYNVQYKKTHSQTLLPMLDELARMTELDMESVDAVAIASGPGSFTGLRIGSSTAKGLAQALNVPVIEIPTLTGLACNLYGTNAWICPIMDARRGEVYTGVYAYGEDVPDASGNDHVPLKNILPDEAVALPTLVEQLHTLSRSDPDREIVFLGDGVPVFRDLIEETLMAPHYYAPAHLSRQRAAAFVYLAMDYYREGRFVSCGAHAPTYMRPSQAERERDEGIVRKGSSYR